MARPGTAKGYPRGQVHWEIIVPDHQAYPELLVRFKIRACSMDGLGPLILPPPLLLLATLDTWALCQTGTRTQGGAA